MLRPHLSTGAWLFCAIVVAALIAPAGVYAAVNSRVAIGNTGNGVTAEVTNERQLLTTAVASNDVVRIAVFAIFKGCRVLYIPPAGKSLVLLSATIEIRNSAPSNDTMYISSGSCGAVWDIFASTLALDTQQHVYPAGLPINNLAIYNNATSVDVAATGYLIPVGQLPFLTGGNGITPAKQNH
jgi:hypothetical protein